MAAADDRAGLVTMVHIDAPFYHGCCAGVVVAGDRIVRAAPILVRSCKAAGWSAARLAAYWRGRGAIVEVTG